MLTKKYLWRSVLDFHLATKQFAKDTSQHSSKVSSKELNSMYLQNTFSVEKIFTRYLMPKVVI